MARTPAHVVSHTHWDRAWYLPFQRYRVHLVGLVDGLLELLEREPRFASFTLDGQTALLDDYLAVRPPRQRERLRALVTAGRLEIGPWFVLPDALLPSGEALIRNLQRGLATARSLGAAPRDGYMPDSFGHIEQMPQLLAGFELRSFLFMRGLDLDAWERLGCEFTWRAPDGSEVLAIYLREGYLDSSALGHPEQFGDFEGRTPDVELARERIEASVSTRLERTPSGLLLLLNGCDHMPVQPELPDLLDALRDELPDLEFTHGTIAGYVDDVLAVAAERGVYEGDLLGNAHHPVLSNVWSARVGLKLANARAQWWLEQIVEPLCVAAGDRGVELGALVDEAWRLLLLNHAHDDICGCSVDSVHEDDAVRFREIEEIADEVAHECVRELARLAGFVRDDGSQHLFVFEPNLRSVAGVVEADVFFPKVEERAPPEGLALYDPDGERTDVQVIDRQLDAFRALRCDTGFGTRFRVAFSVSEGRGPSFGFWRVEGLATDTSERDDTTAIENGTWRVRADAGGVHLEHVSTGVVLEDAIWFESTADAGDEYTYGQVGDRARTTRGHAPSVRRVASGPVFDEIEVAWRMRRPRALDCASEIELPVSLRLRLPRGNGELEVRAAVDNRAEDHRLRLVFATESATDHAHAGGAFTVTRRERVSEELPDVPDCYPGERPYPTLFCRDFVQVPGSRIDLLIALRGLHEFELVDGGVAITLLRAVGVLSRTTTWRKVQAGPSLPTPGAQCAGEHEFELELTGLPSGSDPATAAARAFAFTRPPFAAQARLVPHGEAASAPRAGDVLFELDGSDIALSACRLVDDDRVVIRIWNLATAARAARLTPSGGLLRGRRLARAQRVNLGEDPIDELAIESGSVALELGPRHIETLLLTFSES